MLFALSLLALATAHPSNPMFEFVGFVTKHNKSYTRDEFAERYKHFRNNLAFIRKTNAEGHSYKLAVNEFADMPFHEFHQHYFGAKQIKNPYIRSQNSKGFQISSSSPNTVDWVSKGAVTPVKNQGQCGSCWAFSTTGSVEGAVYLATGKLHSLSEQELVDCAGSYGNYGCNGGLMDYGFEFVIKNGLCSESAYPYKAEDGTCKKSSCTPTIKAGLVSGYKDVPADDEAALKSAVSQQPVSVAIEADTSVFQFYTSGVITSSGCGTNLDHGVLVVGYGSKNGTPYWKVKNSWGSNWGQNGYVLIERNAGGAGICGIASQPSYPTVN